MLEFKTLKKADQIILLKEGKIISGVYEGNSLAASNNSFISNMNGENMNENEFISRGPSNKKEDIRMPSVEQQQQRSRSKEKSNCTFIINFSDMEEVLLFLF